MILQSSDNPSINAEKGEQILLPSGILAKVSGKPHSEGGTDLNVESGSKIFSKAVKLPKEIVAEILDKKVSQVSKMSPADLASKFPTEKHIDDLQSDDKDKYAKNTAEINLKKNLAKLETIFQAQEKFKDAKGIQSGKLMTQSQKDSMQVGGIIRNKRPYLKELPDIKPTPYDANYYRRNMQPQMEIVSTPEGYGFFNEKNQFVLVGDNPNPNSVYDPTAMPYKVKSNGKNYDLTYDNFYQTNNYVPKGSRDYNLNSKAYAENTGYDLSTKKYLNTPEALAFNRSTLLNPDISKKYTSFNSTYIPTILDESGKPIARLYNGEYRKELGYGNVPIKSQEEISKLLNENPNYRVEFSGTTKDLTSDPRNAFATGKNAKLNLDDSDKKSLTIPITKQYSIPNETSSFDINSLPGYTTAVSSNIQNDGKMEVLGKSEDSYRVRELEELERAKLSNTLDLITQRKATPYLANVTKVPSYQRYVPLNTLAAERSQSFQNKTLNNSDASTQLSQAMLSDNYAKFLDNQSKTNIENAQQANGVDNQNALTYSTIYNENKLNNANAMATYARENQQVEDQYDYERDRILNNGRQLDLNKSRIYDSADRENILSKEIGDPYLPSGILKKNGKYYRNVKFNPNNRYNYPNNYQWLNSDTNESGNQITLNEVRAAIMEDPKKGEQLFNLYKLQQEKKK